MTKPTPLVPAAVLEADDPFLQLWPHRYDYIYAKHPPLGQKPDWKTESRHPLSDRLINQGSYLYGVRFGPTTNYLMLDIDIGSPYHPQQHSQTLNRIQETLEPLGLIDWLICNSSDSGGLHLYFPFSQPQPSWEIALATATLLENRGLVLAPGTLEIFPNPKAYSGDAPSLYNGHRLPLQGLSFLLNENLEPIFSNRDTFTAAWQHSERRNDINTDTLKEVLRSAHRHNYRVTGKAEKFLNDLNTDIESGWTGPKQTNYILGRIAMRTYIFGHILGAPKPLEGDDLVEAIIRIARSLPGYEEWCNHKDELEKKAHDWARAVEKSHYFPYGSKVKKEEQEENPAEPSENQKRSLEARERIRLAIATLLEEERLPAGTRARFMILTQEFHLSGETLYRQKDLWHPKHLYDSPPHPPNSKKEASEQEALEEPLAQISPTSLLGADARNTPPDKGLETPIEEIDAETARNILEIKRSIRSILENATQKQARARETAQLNRAEADRQRQEQAQAAWREEIEAFLDSGDGVLIREALSRLGERYNEFPLARQFSTSLVQTSQRKPKQYCRVSNAESRVMFTASFAFHRAPAHQGTLWGGT
jgi:hypothetical protein